NDVYQLSLWDGKVFFRVRTTAGDNYVRSVNTVPVGQWSNVVGVREGNLLKMYINGVQDPTTTAVFGAGLTEHLGLKIGFHLPSSPNAFKGLVDEVGIFNRALSSNEIKDLQHWQRWDVRSCHGS
ncbi:MAG: LamG domain-containing protein, partial [Candidatus Taylorbacteria bacterium]|nr:LamG domain-containing protein [Candidatus Taylorbacteria bacterium]